MNRRKTLRLIALLLAALLLLQSAAAAVEPAGPRAGTKAPESSGETPGSPAETPDEPGENPGEPGENPGEPGENPGEPGENPGEPGENPGEPGENPGEPGENPGEPGENPPVILPIVLIPSMEDGQVVNKPRQTLTIEATQGENILPPEQIAVFLNGETVAAGEDGSYALKLELGDNAVEISAVSEEETASLSITVRYEIIIPGGWAHKALAFCVDNGILKGDQNGDLTPTSNATRAELAAMLVRLFNAQPMDSLSDFSDVSVEEWYHDEMARAVAMGIYKGSGGRLKPKDRITREEAFVVLARAFGVVAASEDALSKVPDQNKISAWARNSVAGMLEAGYINGYKDGSLNPKGYITRQELAQVLYNALDCITDDPDELTGSRCLYTGPAAALEGRQVNGSLIISSPDKEDVNLEDLKVSGRLVLHLHEVRNAALGDVSDTVSLCSPTALTLKSDVKTVNCLREGASVSGNADLAVLDGGGALHGKYDRVVCLSGNNIISGYATVGTVETNGNVSGTTITVNGEVGELHARGRKTTVDGAGMVGTLYQYYSDLDVSCGVGNTVDRTDAGLKGVKIEAGEIPDAFYDVTTVTVTGSVTGVNTTQVYGVPDGVRLCTVTYRYGGKVIKTEKNFRLTEGAKLSCEVTPTLKYKEVEEQDVSVTIEYQDQTVTGTLKLRANGRFTPLNEAKNIRTCYVTAEVNYSTGIYSYSSLSGWLSSVSGGTIVYFLKSDGNAALIQTAGGLRGWVPDSAIRVGWRTYHNDSVSYTKEGKEAFVNQLHDYSSSTDYLIWVNLYTTTVNIFQGSKGNWKLIKSCECVIGAPNTPTRPGVYSIYSKTNNWYFGPSAAGRNDASRCYYVSLFDGGIAFHTRLKYTSTGGYVNSALSAELSHGCVRCPDDIALFIYNNCYIGTRVVVY